MGIYTNSSLFGVSVCLTHLPKMSLVSCGGLQVQIKFLLLLSWKVRWLSLSGFSLWMFFKPSLPLFFRARLQLQTECMPAEFSLKIVVFVVTGKLSRSFLSNAFIWLTDGPASYFKSWVILNSGLLEKMWRPPFCLLVGWNPKVALHEGKCLCNGECSAILVYPLAAETSTSHIPLFCGDSPGYQKQLLWRNWRLVVCS